MGSQTDIEWADRTWNPVTGCSKISSGCKYCYAETQAERFAGGRAFPNGFALTLKPHKLSEPLRWRRPAKVFVNSMSDLFHRDIPEDYLIDIFAVMALSQKHTFQVLTKRPLQAKEWYSQWEIENSVLWAAQQLGNIRFITASPGWPLPNLWLGVSVELQKHLNRIEDLHEIPAAVKFVSLEPLLNAIDFDQLAEHLRGIDWVIIGGESGPKARPCMPEWIRNCVKAARAAGCAVFVKQMGSWWANHNSKDYKGGLMSEWPEDLRVREFPEVGR